METSTASRETGTVTVDLLEETLAPGPVVETPRTICVIASARTLDEAAKLAVERARDLLARHLQISTHDAMMLLSLQADLRISQVVNPLRTVRVSIPKTLLPGLV